MLLILPPSESKRPGGETGMRLDLARLSFPELTRAREAALDALVRLSDDVEAAMAALRLGPKLRVEAERNRELLHAPTAPALDRFDGVLYDALDAAMLSVEARSAAGDRVAIASALFGLLGALDPIPAYRLSADSRLPGVRLRALWREPIAQVLAARTGLLLDLRSEAYAALGPIPERDDARYLRVVTDDGAGQRRALNHFNKAGKGALVRALLESGAAPASVDELLAWGRSAGVRLEPGRPGEIALVVGT